MFRVSDAFSPAFLQQGADELWKEISPNYCVDEDLWLQQLLEYPVTDHEQRTAIAQNASQLIEQVRNSSAGTHAIDALLLQYSLDTLEGIQLMCLAEALLRIPDEATADALIRDKLSVAEWEQHLSKSDSILVNASTWGLMLTGKIVTMDSDDDGQPAGIISRLVNKLGEPVIRQAVSQAMKIMGKHFILGATIKKAIANGKANRDKGYTYSYDMLGEAALTAEDASLYKASYLHAIQVIGANQDGDSIADGDNSSSNGIGRSGISIKLSALHPRYEVAQQERAMTELFDTVLELVRAARTNNVPVNLDAEEQDRHELFLRIFEKLYRHPDCQGWGELGLVIQAYGKRALPTLCWLTALAQEQGDRIPVRLVKGAYWDAEIKLSQQKGYDAYPVYTRKEATDVAYLVCASFLLSPAVQGVLFPQFATHNVHTVASVLAMAAATQTSDYEFQQLHGMGDALYQLVLAQEQQRVRIYAPVGSHSDLLPYLVRRLLENGANSSFVHRLVDAKVPVEELVRYPAEELVQHDSLANPRIVLPGHLFGRARQNSHGVNVDIEAIATPFFEAVESFAKHRWEKGPIINGQQQNTAFFKEVTAPYQSSSVTGRIYWSTETEVEQALESANRAFPGWNSTPANERAAKLITLSDLLEKNQAELVALCHREAGKTIHDAIDEIREAVDFCRYYAQQAIETFAEPQTLLGPTGESNTLALNGRGVFLCISPWNFPLAIFMGQITAALAAGNTVIAKPAEQTSLIAARAVELMLAAGIPEAAIHLLPGDGAQMGGRLLSDRRISGVAFTGSTVTAGVINRTLANRDGAIIPLIAETGGQNAMIVDSTALPEQVIKDVLLSAFGSAGQRCSALRVLYLQEDVAERMLTLLRGAMAELVVGDPSQHATDIGPVIDAQAQAALMAHIQRMDEEAIRVAECPLPTGCANGTFIAAVAFEIDHVNRLGSEHFGPILHVIRYQATELPRVIEQINGTGFGLTLGIHSRNEQTTAYIQQSVHVGNTYINRNQTGAVVGVQPFGGHGLSGTGPKAGGPHYLYRFATEQTVSTNTTAVGGNASLLALGSVNLS